MNQYSYIKLDHTERVFLLNSYGSYVAQREYYIYNITLYTMFGFFVEAWRFNESKEIAKIEVQENDKALELYLKDIDIGALLI